MFFENLNEQQFSELFVAINQEKIKQDLKIKYLDTDTVVQKLCEFFIENKGGLCASFKNSDNIWQDENFYADVINYLKNAKKRGAALEMSAKEYINYLRKKLRKHTFID